MKYVTTLSVALGTALSFGSQVLAQTVQPPGHGQFIQPPQSSVTIPPSSLAKPEDRGTAAHTNTRFIPPKALAPLPQSGPSPLVGPPFAGYGYETPGSLACLYGLVAATAGCNPNTAKTVPTANGSKAIAIVDAYHYVTALADLQKFSTQFGLPAPKLTVKFATATGACNGPQPSTDAGWEGEAALDIQMAHAMAPQATIYLVEAQTNSFANLLGAVKCANSLLTAAGGGELSMSWGGGEFSGETSNDATYFITPKVVYFASSGDSPGPSWPSTSTHVVSVGGTSISRAIPSFNFQNYASWSEAGEGPSTFYALPAYQSGVTGITGTRRVTPDISADANPATGVWVYDSNPVFGIGWFIYGGTSVASPLMAGITNAHATFSANTTAELTAIYNAKKASPTAAFAIPTTGYCGPYASYTVNANWNFCVGVGTVKGAITPLIQAQQ